LHSNDVASAIVGHLADRPSSLVAMATNARGPVGERAFTSVSEAVLASQVAPILLFGPHYEPSSAPEPPTLVVALDETEESAVVLSTAGLWTATFGGLTKFVAVVPPRADDQQRPHVVEHIALGIHDHAPDTTAEVVDGRRPAVALLDYGHRLDNVVMAMASGHWTDDHVHLRSVTRTVTHRSHFPVLVVPRIHAVATSGRTDDQAT
jgi:nucleotide-binding universal stress UspA family protein